MSKFALHSSVIAIVLALDPLSNAAIADLASVQIEPLSSVVTLGDPLIAFATVTNPGAVPIKVIHHNAPTLDLSDRSIVAIRFGGDQERLTEWSDGLRPLSEKSEPMILLPGQSVTIRLVVLFNSRDGFFAKEPGTYWIQGRIVVLASPYKEILSTPVPIHVRAPASEDRETWDWINANKEEYGRMVQVPWEAKLSEDFVRECARRCETARSTYAEYLALFLSRSYQEGPRKNPVEAARFAEIAKARASSERVRVEADRVLEKSRPQGTKP